MTEEAKNALAKWGAPARDLASIVAALMIIGSAVLFLWRGSALVTTFVQDAAGTSTLVEDINAIKEQNEALLDRTTNLVDRVDILEQVQLSSSEPTLLFEDQGHAVSNVRQHGLLRARFMITKLRDCGRPKGLLHIWDSEGILHTLTELSLLDRDGRLPALPVRPDRVQSLAFTAQLPEENGDLLALGPALVRMEIYEYSDCPRVPTITSPIIQIEVLEPEDG